MTDEPRVTTLELFFDLVFVFAVTEVTIVLAEGGLGEGLLHGALILLLLMWMYGGYVWLTNAVPIDSLPRQLLLLSGMAGFLLLALAIPRAFGEGGTLFGVAYLVVNAIHAGLFRLTVSEGSRHAMNLIGSVNVGLAGVVVLGGVLGGDAQLVLWLVVVVVQVYMLGFVGRQDEFEIAPGHFVERHGLIVLITIGESVVAVGLGATELPIGAGLVIVTVLGLALSACLWWAYFGDHADERAGATMRAADPVRRARLAGIGYGYWLFAMLFGIIAIAAGLESVIAHPFDPAEPAAAVFLAGGTALFLWCVTGFRWTLSVGVGPALPVAGAVGLVAILLGERSSAVLELVALVALFVLALARDARSREGRPRSGDL